MQLQSSSVVLRFCKYLSKPRLVQSKHQPVTVLHLFCAECFSVENPSKILTVLQGCHVPDLPTVKAKRCMLTVTQRLKHKLMIMEVGLRLKNSNTFIAKTFNLNCTSCPKSCATKLACASLTAETRRQKSSNRRHQGRLTSNEILLQLSSHI